MSFKSNLLVSLGSSWKLTHLEAANLAFTGIGVCLFWGRGSISHPLLGWTYQKPYPHYRKVVFSIRKLGSEYQKSSLTNRSHPCHLAIFCVQIPTTGLQGIYLHWQRWVSEGWNTAPKNTTYADEISRPSWPPNGVRCFVHTDPWHT